MNIRFVPLSCGLALCLVLSSAASVSAEPGADEPTAADYAQARALYQKASQAFEEGHYTDARNLLLDAWALRQSYDVAASLGDTEIKLGLFPEAAEHLSFSLRTFPPLENEAALANVRRQLEVARHEAAAVRVSVDEAGAEVRVDDRLVGTSPLAEPVFVAPGQHTVEVRKGAGVQTRIVVSEAAKETAVSLELASLTPAPPPPDETAPRSVVPLIVGGAVVAAGLTAGIAFRLSADANDDHANGIRARLGAGACAGQAGSSADCTALRNDVNDSSRSSALSTTGFVIAGVGLVATPLWYLLAPRAKRTSTVGFSAWVMPGLTAVSASGRF
ncbi:MAG TPA: hypothetical protein VH062_22940 [Polyangiaceae bacterium]|jgi:tetratricopeptide (TPR) repeat protein|nr:hypothetical protein [Polyangiaceae bacterium]